MASNPWRKRPYSPHESPQRNTRLRNAIHRDVLFEQGIPPLFATFSSRGSRAICCFRNGFARVWNVDPVHDRFLDCQHVLRHTETVFRAAIADDGTRAVTTAGDGVARVWELQSPHPRCKELACQFRSTRTCDISSDGQFVAATFYTGKRAPLSMYRGMIILYEPARDFYLFRISVYGVPDKVKVSRDATTIAVGCYGVNPAKNFAKDNRITIFNREGTEIICFEKCFPNHDSCVSWDLSDDGQVLAICAKNRQLIHVYSNRDQRTWKDPPRVLSANADLTYETCRIVDNGDLISTIAHDNKTDERSILVFSPARGGVLFSLACGLLDQRACLDIEPRVCYVAPSHDGPGRKVVRLLARTGGNNTGVLELVRCGDPPKGTSHGPNTSLDSAPSFSQRDNLVAPTKPSVPPQPDQSPTLPRLVPDCPNPTPPKAADWSPAQGSAQPVRSTSLPHDDKFKLRKAVTKETATHLSPFRSSPLNSPSPTSTKLTQKKRIPRTPEPEVPVHEVHKPTKSVADASKQGSSSNSSNIPTKSPSKGLQVSPKAQKPAEIVLSPESAVVKRYEPARSMAEKLSCKSTILSNSTLRATPSPKQTVTPDGANIPATKHSEPPIVQKAPNVSDAQASSKTDLTTSESNESKNNETTNLTLLSETTKRTHNSITETKITTIPAKKPEQTAKDSDLETGELPVSNLKKPRWQPARLRARKKMLENAALESKTEGPTSGPSRQRNVITGSLDRARPVEEKVHQGIPLNDRTEERAGVPGSSKPVENPGQSVHDSRKHSEAKIPCDQVSQGISASPAIEISEPPRPQNTTSFSLPRIPGSYAQHEVSKWLGEADNGARKVKRPATTMANLVSSAYNTLAQVPERQDSAVDGEALSAHPIHGLKKEETAPGTPKERTAKEETVLDHADIKASPNAVILPSPTSLNATHAPSTQVKADPREEHGQNRYLDAVERAKTMFRGASHKVEEGVPVLSNVKAFKTMLEVVANESEVVERKDVAKIVYEKGGINNTLNEDLFLEAFSQLYEELQGLRQQQWIEVYNQAAAGDGEGLLVFHARDLIKRESRALKTGLNPIWSDDALDELIASQTADGVLVSQDAFVQSTEKIFSV